MKRHLLRRDGRHDALEGIDGKRRTEAAQGRDEARQNRLGGGKRVERLEDELEAEELAHDGSRLDVERLDLHPAVRSDDPDLAAGDHTVQTVVVPEVREIRAERPVALRRQLEVVRIRDAQVAHAATLSRAVTVRT